jgi:CubicO group peptidase (beta-lactamase class C family)
LTLCATHFKQKSSAVIGYNFSIWEISNMNRLSNKLIATAIIVSMSFAGSAVAQNPGKIWMQYATPEEAGFSSEKLKSVENLYEKNAASALLVVYDGNVLLSKGDIARRYDTHSMRKSLISALYGIHDASGKIDINRTLKEIGIDDSAKLTYQEQLATIQDLLKARSGIYIPAFGEVKSMSDSRPVRGSHPPNTFFYYNNWDFNVLGTIFQTVTGLGLFEAFDESLAKPLDMEDLRPIDGRFWRDTTQQTIYPKYDIKMSARDLARFGTLYCNGGVWNSQQILSKDWISASFTSYSKTNDVTPGGGYGYLWWIQVLDDSIPMYTARGWGGHFLAVVPRYKLVVVKRHDTFSGRGGAAAAESYVRMVIAARTSEPVPKPKLDPLEVRSWQAHFLEMPEANLRKYEQEFFMNGRTRTMRYGKYGLVFDDWYVLHAISDTQFFIEDLDKYAYFKFENGRPVFDKVE